jgi:hypothetical protein
MIEQRFPEFLRLLISKLESQIQLKNIQHKSNTYTLTQQGKLLADAISSDLFV